MLALYLHCAHVLTKEYLKNWRHNVKARLFVITLRDHFADKGQDSAAPSASGQSGKPKNPQDSWAGQYVSVKYLRPIMDAIDDDGSGHITITEVNRFMEELPASLDWRCGCF